MYFYGEGNDFIYMKTIGIIGAMPSELADIRKSLTGAVIKNYSGFLIFT